MAFIEGVELTHCTSKIVALGNLSQVDEEY